MNPKIENYDLGGILLGDNEFESGTLVIANGESVKDGAFLKRNADGSFAVVTDTGTETPVALHVDGELANDSGAEKKFAVRVLTGGRVAASKCHVNGTTPTAAQLDMLRSYGIRAVSITEVNKLDNQ